MMAYTYIYIYIYVHTHTYTHIYIYIYIIAHRIVVLCCAAAASLRRLRRRLARLRRVAPGVAAASPRGNRGTDDTSCKPVDSFVCVCVLRLWFMFSFLMCMLSCCFAVCLVDYLRATSRLSPIQVCHILQSIHEQRIWISEGWSQADSSL